MSSAAHRERPPETADVVVVGAGFGGLGTALRLSELGARVVVLEALSYPGGCASTFTRDGYRFESGATLFSGLGRGQLFHRWIERYRLDVAVEWLDPVVELRAPGSRLSVPASRTEFVAKMAEAPEARRGAVRRFFEHQGVIADVLWSVLDAPERLPPFGWRELALHARRLHRYRPLLGTVGVSLAHVMRRYGVEGHELLGLFVKAISQITVQCEPREAEALYALATMDYFFRGTGHVRGGIGKLAWGLVDAIRGAGGTVVLPARVHRVERTRGGYRVESSRGALETPAVVANVLPQSVRELTGLDDAELARAERLGAEVERGWGACMLYRVVRAPSGVSDHPMHLQLVGDPSSPLVEGNHVFCSFSGAHDEGRAPAGYRTLTVSTHVPVAKLRMMTLAEQAAYVEGVQRRMRETLAARAPEWERDVRHELTASPRTFERFTKRFFGYVGGTPRRVGWHNYRGIVPRAIVPGLYLVGDTMFPGQSTLATALGGYKLAEHVARRLPA